MEPKEIAHEGDAGSSVSGTCTASEIQAPTRKRRRNSIRLRLASLVVACVLPVWIAAGFLVYYNYQSRRALTEQRMLETARALTMVVDRELANMQAALSVLATTPSLASGDLSAFYHRAQVVLDNHPGAHINLSDVTGQELLNTARPFGAPLPKRNALDARSIYTTGRPLTSSVFKGAVTGKFAISVDVPVFRDGRVLYDLAMVVTSDRFAHVLSQQQLPPEWVGDIFDSNQVIVARTDSAETFVGRQARPFLGQRMRNAAEGTVEFINFAGVPMFDSFSRSATSNWTVMIGVPKAIMMADIWRGLWWALACAAGLSLAGILMALMMARRISGSIHGLIAPALALGRGEPVIIEHLELAETDEVGESLAKASQLIQQRAEERARAEAARRESVELKRLNAELEQSEAETRARAAELAAIMERLQAILDNAPIAISTFDEHGVLLEANPALYRIMGYSESELIGKNFADYTHPDDREKNLVLHRQLSSGERQAYELEKRYICKDGSVIWAHTRVAVLDNKTRVSIAEDITARKQAQEQLMRTAERLQAILDNAPVGIVITDREGRVIEYNAAHLRMCGLSPEELKGATFATYTHPDDIAKNLELFGLVTSGKLPSVEIEKRYLRKDGTIIWVHVTSSSINKDFNIGIVEDITARKQAEQQLRATADRLKAILEHAPVGIVTGSREYRFLETNAAFQQMTGYSGDELRQMDWTTLTHPDDIAPNVELVDKLFAGEIEVYEYEKRYLPKNGKTIWVRIIGARVDSEMKMSIVEDITERKQAEDALRKSEAGLTAAQRIAHIGSWQWDIQNDDAYWSGETFRIFDFVPDRLEGHRKTFLSRIHPADRQRVDDALSDALMSGTREYDQEYRICLPDGSEKVIHAQAEVLRDDDGKPVVMQGTVHDITERKRAQQALAESQERLQTIVQNAPVGVSLLDRKGCVQEANPALCHILGYSAEELKSRSFKEYTHPDDLQYSQFDKWDRQPYELEKRYIRKDGSVVWVRVLACPINHDFMIGIVEDITARKRDEEQRRRLGEQLRQAQKMEAVGHLAGGVAHDFNNLLMVIQSYAEMLQESLPANDRLRRNTQEILKAAARAAGLTRQLLAFSRKQILSPVVLDLNAVVDEAARMLKRLISEDIEFRLSPAESLWAIKADPDQIVQVLMNLCVNARDAMPQGGALTIATGNVTADAGLERPYVAPGDYVMLSVTDTGMGISKEVLGSIFDPFFTTKGVGKGTGLGLATVYGIVKQSGGYVWVDSELGRGSCFTVYLPREKGAIASDKSAKAAAQPRGTGTILVAEDEEALREAVCDYLRGLGYTVLEASSGQNALAVLSEHEEHLDLLITDLVMPQMGGKELAQMLGTLRPDLKMIYMSGYADDAALRHGILEANATFLQKPFNLDALARKVRETLGQTEPVQR